MFAFAIYDKQKKELYLIRDRMGEKPLFYSITNGILLFGSEIRCFNQLNNFKINFNSNAIDHFINFGFFNKNLSIYKNLFKIEPGTYLKISYDNFKPHIVNYWNLIENCANSISNNNDYNKDNINNILNTVVKEHLISDVSVGTYLSSGIDSALITSIAAENYKKKIETFTVGFDDNFLDESKYAREISKYLNTNHNEIFCDSNTIKNNIPDIHKFSDEPFADISLLPTFLLSKKACDIVKVILTGDGGDEVFAGYNRHRYVYNFWHIQKTFPLFSKTISKFLKIKKNQEINYYKLSKILTAENIFELYQKFLLDSENSNQSSIFQQNSNYEKLNYLKISDFNKFIILDLLNYLPNNILVKSDRASMINSLELRSPFLDKRIIDYSFSLSNKSKINFFDQKIILKKLLQKKLPQRLINNKKKGFTPPIKKWMKKDLRGWCQSLVNDTKNNEFISKKLINKDWEHFIKKNTNNYKYIWNVIILQNWMNNQS